MNNKSSFLIYFDWEEPFNCLDDESLGIIFRAIMKYAKHGELTQFTDPSLAIIFSFVRNAIDRDARAYEERCKKNRENAKKAVESRAKSGNTAALPPNGFQELLNTIS